MWTTRIKDIEVLCVKWVKKDLISSWESKIKPGLLLCFFIIGLIHKCCKEEIEVSEETANERKEDYRDMEFWSLWKEMQVNFRYGGPSKFSDIKKNLQERIKKWKYYHIRGSELTILKHHFSNFLST